jgi:hypothetical protein
MSSSTTGGDFYSQNYWMNVDTTTSVSTDWSNDTRTWTEEFRIPWRTVQSNISWDLREPPRPRARVHFDHLSNTLDIVLEPNQGTRDAMLECLELAAQEMRGLSEGRTRLYEAFREGVCPGVMGDWEGRLPEPEIGRHLTWPAQGRERMTVSLPREIREVARPEEALDWEADRRVVRQDYEPVRRAYTYAHPSIAMTRIEVAWWTWERVEAVGKCRVPVYEEGVGWWEERTITADEELPEGAEFVLSDAIEHYTAPDWVIRRARELGVGGFRRIPDDPR